LNPSNVNSAIEYYIQVGDCSDTQLRAKLILFAQLANEPCFDQLRTKEQLGYMVFSGVRKQTGMMGFRVIIQSEKSPLYLESRIELFINGLRDTILQMSPEDYKKNAESLSLKLVEKNKNLGQEVRKAWSNIVSRYYDFGQYVRDSQDVLKVTQVELVEFFDTHISTASPSRKKLSVHMKSQSAVQLDTDYKEIVGKNTIVSDDGLVAFKSAMALGPFAKPVAKILEYFDQRMEIITKL